MKSEGRGTYDLCRTDSKPAVFSIRKPGKGYKSDYAGITKAAALANDRVYREVERRQENTATAEKKVHEEKRKRSLSRLPQIMGKGRLINQYV